MKTQMTTPRAVSPDNTAYMELRLTELAVRLDLEPRAALAA